MTQNYYEAADGRRQCLNPKHRTGCKCFEATEQTQPTPGWRQAGDYVVDADGKMVACTSKAAAFIHQDEWAQQPATFASDRYAKLISAAPDLLAALRELLAEAWPVPMAERYKTNAHRLAEAAIAKAEGRK